jgi:hypothetical protein
MLVDGLVSAATSVVGCTTMSFADLALSIHVNGLGSALSTFGRTEIVPTADRLDEIVKGVVTGVITERATFLIDAVTTGLVGPTVVAKTAVRLTSVPKIFQKVVAGAWVPAEGVRNAVLTANPTINDTRANLDMKLITI